jgi:hypothetical protein
MLSQNVARPKYVIFIDLFDFILQSLKQKEFCLIFLKKSRRKVLKLVQFPVSTRRHVKTLLVYAHFVIF